MTIDTNSEIIQKIIKILKDVIDEETYRFLDQVLDEAGVSEENKWPVKSYLEKSNLFKIDKTGKVDNKQLIRLTKEGRSFKF